MAHTLISAQTGAVSTKAEFAVVDVPATLLATGLAGAEEADIFISPDQGTTWATLGMEEGTGTPAVVTLTATRTAFVIEAPMYIGVTKDASTGAAGVFLSDLTDT